MELLPPFRLARPETIEQIVALKAETLDARFVAGGTDILPNARRGLIAAELLIDLTACPQLGAIEADADGCVIGAAVALEAVADHLAVRQDYPAVAEAAGSVAGPTQRGMATVGGNLCLDTRCIFYNQSEWWRQSNDYCLKYRGEICHVVPSSKRCYAAYSGDLAAALLVHGAIVEIAGPDGHRELPVNDLFADDGIQYLTLNDDELVVAVRLPPPEPDMRTSYQKIRVRSSIDFPLAGVAVGVRGAPDAVTGLSAGLTGTNSRPVLLDATDLIENNSIDGQVAEGLAARVRKAVSPVRTGLIQPQYRRRAIAALAAKMALELGG